MKTIRYIGYYDTILNKKENRNYVLSAKNKMDYICEILVKCNYNVEIVSVSNTKNNEFYKKKKIDINSKIKLFLFSTIPSKNAIHKLFRLLNTKFNLFVYFFKNIHRNDKVIVYHSLGYYKLLAILKRIIGFKMILEVEEIYSDVTGNEKTRAKELAFFKLADAYIFPTELLDQYVNTEHKPSTIVYGTYKVEKERGHKFNKEDGKIHLVYAGTFDPRKGGVSVAIATGECLDKKFHIHILGFGSEEEKKVLEKQIEEVNSKNGAIVTMDGLLSGEDYIKFLQSCDAGFSTQNPDADFNDTSFPSKVLSYLSNGLRVVSVRIKALEKSKVGDLLYFYDGNNPKKIAETIKSINFDEAYDSRDLISQLDKEFTDNFKKIL